MTIITWIIIGLLLIAAFRKTNAPQADDLAQTFVHVPCPHCGSEVITQIGEIGACCPTCDGVLFLEDSHRKPT